MREENRLADEGRGWVGSDEYHNILMVYYS